MHGQDRLGPRRDRGLDRGRVHRPGRRVDVDEDRGRPGVDDRGDRGDEGHRHGDHLVARPDPGREQREMQRRGARVHRDGVPDAAVGREAPPRSARPGRRARSCSCAGPRGPRSRAPGRWTRYCAVRSRNGIMTPAAPVRARPAGRASPSTASRRRAARPRAGRRRRRSRDGLPSRCSGRTPRPR